MGKDLGMGMGMGMEMGRVWEGMNWDAGGEERLKRVWLSV